MRIFQVTSIVLIAVVAMVFSSVALLGTPASSPPPACHQHKRQNPSPAPVNHNCCEMGHQVSAIASSYVSMAVIAPIATTELIEQSTHASREGPVVVTLFSRLDNVPLRI